MRRLLASAFAVAVCSLSGSAAFQPVRPVERWQEMTWPFPRDGWPAGRAFHCAGEPCGDDVELYVRPKIGFCNCDAGVADDDEVDRVADLDLMSERFAPHELGKAVARRCDLLVVVAQGKGAASGVQRVALDFLGSEKLTPWMTVAMEGPR